MIRNSEQLVTLTTNIETSDGHAYDGGEVGHVLARGGCGDPTILALFAGRPPLCVTPGDTCVIGRLAVA